MKGENLLRMRRKGERTGDMVSSKPLKILRLIPSALSFLKVTGEGVMSLDLSQKHHSGDSVNKGKRGQEQTQRGQ